MPIGRQWKISKRHKSRRSSRKTPDKHDKYLNYLRVSTAKLLKGIKPNSIFITLKGMVLSNQIHSFPLLTTQLRYLPFVSNSSRTVLYRLIFKLGLQPSKGYSMKICTLLLLVSTFGFFTSANAIQENQFSEAHSIYMTAVNGNESDVKKATEYFNKLSESEPYDIFIQTYRGSLESMMAEHVFMPWNKMKHVDAGSELMDDALDEISELHDTITLGETALSVRMKLIVAHTYFRFPRFLNRYQDSKDLVSDLLESANFNNASTETKNSLYQLAAAIAEDDGNKIIQSEFLIKIK